MFRITHIVALCILFVTGVAAMSGEIPAHFPRVRGHYQMTPEWSVTLPDEYAKRFEGRDLVLWRSGITCWTAIYDQKEGEAPETTYEWRKKNLSKDAIEVFEFRDGKPLRFGYLRHEKPDDDRQRWGLYTFTFGVSGHVMMTIYFDRKDDIETAKKIWFSITEAPK